MTTKTLIRNLKRLEKVMVGMSKLPLVRDTDKARHMADAGKIVVCFDLAAYETKKGFCGCVLGYYTMMTGRRATQDCEQLLLKGVFSFYRGKGDTVRSRLAIVRKLIKKLEREDERE